MEKIGIYLMYFAELQKYSLITYITHAAYRPWNISDRKIKFTIK